jgi:hypothetical protein
LYISVRYTTILQGEFHGLDAPFTYSGFFELRSGAIIESDHQASEGCIENGRKEFLGNSAAFDFYCEYSKFDFSRFDVSWLLNLYPHTLEQIAKNSKVKERVRIAIATTLDGKAIASSDSQRLHKILVKHFC